MRQSSRSRSSTLDWGHDGCIRELLQEDGCSSSMYRIMIMYLCWRKKKSWVTCNMSPVINYDYSMICKQSLQYWSMFIFRRLKINHDSHEFILEFSTVVNSYIYAHILGLSMQRYHDCQHFCENYLDRQLFCANLLQLYKFLWLLKYRCKCCVTDNIASILQICCHF